MIGSERNSAFLKSSSKDFDERLVGARVAELLDRAARGWAFWAAAVAASGGVDAVLGDVVVAGDLERDERGAAVLGELALVALGAAATRPRWTCADRLQARDGVVDRGGERGVADLDRAAGPARAPARRPRRGSRRCRSPGRRPARSRCPCPRRPSCLVPTAPPMTNATMTNASQPKMAVLRCCALQRPARAARFRVCKGGASSGELRGKGSASKIALADRFAHRVARPSAGAAIPHWGGPSPGDGPRSCV